MEPGILLGEEREPSLAIELVGLAESLGYGRAWFGEHVLVRDSLAMVAASAVRTRRIILGSGAINVWTRNVGTVAAAARTLHGLAPHRVVLGIASGEEALERVGVRRERPLRAMEEYVAVLRRLLSGEEVTFSGEHVRVERARVAPAPDGPLDVGIYVAATGTRMLELAGGMADGVILNFLLDDRRIEESVRAVRRGAEARGVRVPEVHALITTAADPDPEAALEEARRFIASFARIAPGFASELGLRGDEGGGGRELRDALPDDLVRGLAAVGTPEECARRLREVAERHGVVPDLHVLGPRPEWTLRRMAEELGLARGRGPGSGRARRTGPRR
ncbi:LLM class flavin-dependent oxidoreductase [Conexivisphaera calida]|uniref:LLM class flavin-dependent oxidoreductase n=1 Tax=Conexivisphaera calida TaxID=1874277 RepID=UPI00157A9BA4|nr:LLM class flavin-dependent oxidoreductase [Conexivisphaera calida]